MKYVALLRGINVGGNNKVEMIKLKRSFEEMGYENVSTYINSGNVIFDSQNLDLDSAARKIENILLQTFGFSIRVVLRTSTDLVRVNKLIPNEWVNDKDQKIDILFLWPEYDKKTTTSLIKTNPEVDTLLYTAGAIIWRVDKSRYNQSGMRKFIGTPVYKNMTARNVNTLRKLVKLVDNTSS